MSTGLIEIMKRAANDANESSNPCDLRYGSVISTNPIKVQISHQFTIPGSMLIVPRMLTDYDVKVIIDDGSEQKMTIKNALKVGDTVAVIRQKGGQKYLILDRVVL